MGPRIRLMSVIANVLLMKQSKYIEKTMPQHQRIESSSHFAMDASRINKYPSPTIYYRSVLHKASICIKIRSLEVDSTQRPHYTVRSHSFLQQSNQHIIIHRSLNWSFIVNDQHLFIVRRSAIESFAVADQSLNLALLLTTTTAVCSTNDEGRVRCSHALESFIWTYTMKCPCKEIHPNHCDCVVRIPSITSLFHITNLER